MKLYLIVRENWIDGERATTSEIKPSSDAFTELKSAELIAKSRDAEKPEKNHTGHMHHVVAVEPVVLGSNEVIVAHNGALCVVRAWQTRSEDIIRDRALRKLTPEERDILLGNRDVPVKEMVRPRKTNRKRKKPGSV
jgi:hypothetical protein